MKILFLITTIISNCFDKPPIDFYLDKTNLEINNLGGNGPDYNKSKVIYIKQIGIDRFDNIFDLNIKAKNYKINQNKEILNYNKIIKNNILEIYIELTKNYYVNKNFEISFLSQNNPIYLDNFYLSLLDIDLNSKTENDKLLRESICVKKDDILINKSFFPKSAEIIYQKNLSCEKKNVNYDTILVKSLKHGSNCDNPKDPFNINYNVCNDLKQSELIFQLAFYKKKYITFNAILECVNKSNELEYLNCSANRKFFITGRTGLSNNCNYDYEKFKCRRLEACYKNQLSYLNCGCCNIPENRERCYEYFNQISTTTSTTPEQIYTVKSTTPEQIYIDKTTIPEQIYTNKTTIYTTFLEQNETNSNSIKIFNTTTMNNNNIIVVDDNTYNSNFNIYALSFTLGCIFLTILTLITVFLIIYYYNNKQNKISPENLNKMKVMII